MKNYLLKNEKRITVKTPTMEANCPTQKMNPVRSLANMVGRLGIRIWT